jgi:hypothetical protein
LAIEEQVLVTTHTFDDRAAAGIDAEETAGKASGDIALDCRTDDDTISVLDELGRHRVGTVVAVEGHVMRHQKATGIAGENLDRQVQLVAIDRRP